jgi:histidyl-tRNA synthetase
MYQAPRGTSDILPDQQSYWRFVHAKVEQSARLFDHHRIDTPTFESTGLFLRTVGEDTDIVQKEMYSFLDRGEQELTLRPEGTAAVCRAYLEHGMHNRPQPVRLYYVSPMFRYDRPQAGRYRQHHQFGAEAIGDGDAMVDVEIIQLAMATVESLGLSGMSLVLNTIGDSADRPGYLKALHSYYAPHQDVLCADCRRRYHNNPLRLLDCKQASCQPFLAEAPRSSDHLGAAAYGHWEALLGYLDELEVPYRLDHRLVRGLDYYTRTVFEVQSANEGAQSSIGAGGRYDGLIEQLGGRPTPGIGFAIGIERVILNLRSQGVEVPAIGPGPVVVAYRGGKAKAAGIQLAARLRHQGIPVVVAPEKSLKAQMRYASGVDAQQVLILGDAELAQGVVTVREMDKGEQRQLRVDEVAADLRRPS